MLLLRRLGFLREAAGGLEGVSFVPDPDHAYPTEECTLELGEAGPTIKTPFFGLLGSLGALPTHLSAWVQERVKEGDRAALDFLGLFQERLTSLFLHAHVRHRFWLSYAWNAASSAGEAPRLDPFQEAVFALLGLSQPASRLRCGLPPLALLYHAGALTRRPCSAEALEGVLGHYFDAPVRIRPFLGGWVPIPAEARSGLGASEPLGESFALGDRYFDPADRFRLEFGPLPRTTFEELLPSARGAAALAALVRFAVGPGQRFDYVLALRSADVPAARLGAGADGARLGQSFWTQAADTDRVRWAGPFEPEPIEEQRAAQQVA